MAQPAYSADRLLVRSLAEKVPSSSQRAALAGALLLGLIAYKWSRSEEGSTLQTLQALKEYSLRTPELKWRKRASAASLAIAYAAHCYCKSNPVSAIAAMGSLMPLYSIYKDISLVGDVQSAKAGREVGDERIKKYMESLCFSHPWPGGFDQSHPDTKHSSRDFFHYPPLSPKTKLREEFFNNYRNENKAQLQKCAQQLLAEKGFVAQKLIDLKQSWKNRTYYEMKNRTYYETWIVPLLILDRIVNKHGYGFERLDYTQYIGGHFINNNAMINSYNVIVGINEGEGKSIKRAR